jgi:glycosyltransferase involved in cell wall biosynthesis
MKKMKSNILLVSDYPIEEVMGGAVRVLYEQSTCLAERGHSVHILTREENFNEGYSKINGVKEWKYKTDNNNPFLFLKSTLSNSQKLFESVVERYSVDNIIFYQPFSAYGILRSKKSYNINKLYSCFSFSFEEFKSRNRRPGGLIKKITFELESFMRKKWEAKVLNNSEKIIALSQFTENRLRDVYSIPKGKIKIIPGGVDLNRFNPIRDKLAIRKQLEVPTEKIILFCVRNLVQRMGLENLINALKIVVRNAPDICLILGGEGVMKDELTALSRKLDLKEYIKFVGYIPEKQLADYYGMADLFVLPTKELEGFGLVTLEAMASGLPVVGTPVGGTKEIIGNFDSSYLFKGTDSNSIAALILTKYQLIKNNYKKWEKISYRCRKFVENNYSWEKNIDSLEELFKKAKNN